MNRRPLLLAALLYQMPMAVLSANPGEITEKPMRPERRREPLPGSNYRRKVPKTDADHAAIERAEAKRARKAAARAPK
jgi:hypothetical protein